MSAVMNLLKAADRCVSVTARTVSTLALAGIFVMFIANVFVRFVPVYNFTQTDDWIQILLVWMIFPGAMELVRTRGHFVVDVITDRVAGTNFGHCCRLAVTVIELVTYALICWYGIVWVLRAQATFQSIPWLQVRWAYVLPGFPPTLPTRPCASLHGSEPTLPQDLVARLKTRSGGLSLPAARSTRRRSVIPP